MKKWLLFLSLAAVLWAEPVETLVKAALESHPSIEAIRLRISAADYAVGRARNLDNPSLTLAINDLRFDDFTNRSLEPMQTQSVAIAQKIP